MELDPKLIVAIVAFLASLTALAKQITDNLKIKADRAMTKDARDKDSQELHDDVQKIKWENARLKEDLAMTRTTLDDHQLQLTTMTTELAKVATKLDSALEILHDLKEARK